MEIYFWKWIYELILLNWKAIYRHQWFPNLCGQMSMLKQILTQVQWKSACWSPKLSQVSILNKKEINRIIEKIWHFPEKIFALLGHFILYEINYLLHFKLFKLIINKINKFKIRKFYRDFNGMHFSFCFLFTDVKLKITTIYNHQNMPLLSWKLAPFQCCTPKGRCGLFGLSARFPRALHHGASIAASRVEEKYYYFSSFE